MDLMIFLTLKYMAHHIRHIKLSFLHLNSINYKIMKHTKNSSCVNIQIPIVITTYRINIRRYL